MLKSVKFSGKLKKIPLPKTRDNSKQKFNIFKFLDIFEHQKTLYFKLKTMFRNITLRNSEYLNTRLQYKNLSDLTSLKY